MNMHVVFLRFSTNKLEAGAFMEAHKAWITRGLDEGVFLLVGTLQPALGGVVVAHGIGRAALDARIAEDPFVANDIVVAEVHELSPAKADPRLAFLLRDPGSTPSANP